jgi:hypothetical protein
MVEKTESRRERNKIKRKNGKSDKRHSLGDDRRDNQWHLMHCEMNCCMMIPWSYVGVLFVY